MHLTGTSLVAVVVTTTLVHPSHAAISHHPALEHPPHILAGLDVAIAVIAGHLESLYLLVQIRISPVVVKPVVTVFTSVIIACCVRIPVVPYGSRAEDDRCE